MRAPRSKSVARCPPPDRLTARLGADNCSSIIFTNVKIRATFPGRLIDDETSAPARLRRHNRFGPRPRWPCQPRSARDARSLRAYPALESGAPEFVDLLRKPQQPAPQWPHADPPGKRWGSHSQMGLSIALARQA